VIKSLVFGVVVTWIALFQGYDAVPTSEGVSRATTRAVVHSALAVLGLDFVLTALMFGLTAECMDASNAVSRSWSAPSWLPGSWPSSFLAMKVSNLSAAGAGEGYGC
jgi:hypothetical protein